MLAIIHPLQSNIFSSPSCNPLETVLSNIPTTEQCLSPPLKHSGHKSDLKWIKLPSWSGWSSCSDSREGGEELFAPVAPRSLAQPQQPAPLLSDHEALSLNGHVAICCNKFFFQTPVDTRKNELRTCNLERRGGGCRGGLGGGGGGWLGSGMGIFLFFFFNNVSALQLVLLTDQLQGFSLGGAAPA